MPGRYQNEDRDDYYNEPYRDYEAREVTTEAMMTATQAIMPGDAIPTTMTNDMLPGESQTASGK